MRFATCAALLKALISLPKPLYFLPMSCLIKRIERSAPRLFESERLRNLYLLAGEEAAVVDVLAHLVEIFPALHFQPREHARLIRFARVIKRGLARVVLEH